MRNILIKFAKRVKGDVHNDLSKCLYCGKCRQKCRVKAITADRQAKEWRWTDEKCVRCGHCIAKCPAKSLSFRK